MILGITGGSGCGKTTALKAVQDLGGLVLDCDAIYHELLACSPALLAAIGARFPGAVSGSELDRKKLGPWNITVDCDVLQGDGGTRTASITGGFVAMMLAFRKMKEEGLIREIPVSGYVAAVSAGIVENQPMLDLCYEEDSSAMVDLNCVMDDQGRLIEIQGTGEGRPFTVEEQRQLVDLCAKGIKQLQSIQRSVLEG